MTIKGPSQPPIKTQIASLFREFAKQVQAMDDSEIERILAGELRFRIQTFAKGTKSRKDKRRCSEETVEHLQGALQKVKTRERARTLIDEFLHTRVDLMHFARVLDVPIPSNASSEQVKDRLVEATVGYRIRSTAIRGKAAGQTHSSAASGDGPDLPRAQPSVPGGPS